MESTVLKAEALTRDFSGGFRAVDGLSFSLKAGEVLGFLGPNGAGKSTSMQMLTGNLAPSAGRINLCGHDLLRSPLIAKKHLGYLPETPPLYRELRVREYLQYAARLRGLSAREARFAVPEVIDRCGLGDVSRQLIDQLSKGYGQRLGIAQAIVHKPDVVILDEPTVGLDPVQIRSVRALIRELGKEHGVILSSHLLAEVQSVCDRVLIIDHGRLVYSADLGESAGCAGFVLRCSCLSDDAQLRIEAIDGVIEVDRVDAELTVLHDGREGMADDIVACVLEQGWGLQSLVPTKPDLEQVFVNLSLHGTPGKQVA